MIVTRRWLEEWVDLDGIGTDEIVKKLNAIGLEVDAVRRFSMPEKVVVGRVLSCEKHPDADKLNVCQIDLGTATRQIVCGASNIAAGQYVPVATVGAVLPDGTKIGHAKLRGVESDGMVCASTELGLPSLQKGIMVLDDSIGALEPGRQLQTYDPLNDDIIEIELTANRGDCLSIHGVARELAAAFDRSMRAPEPASVGELTMGIGRVFQLHHEGEPRVSLRYQACQVESCELPLLMRLRLAMVEADFQSPLEGFLAYATHATGVILRAYDLSKLAVGEGAARLTLKRIDGEAGALYNRDEQVGVVGVNQAESVKADGNESEILVEASYVSPEIIAPLVKKSGIQSDSLYYRTSRGSEPDLAFGLQVFNGLVSRYAKVGLYGGVSEYSRSIEPITLDLAMADVEALVGQKIEIAEAANILTRLGFGVQKVDGCKLVVRVPPFRHDIFNRQDLVEEIVRMIGIDNIRSRPMRFEEANRVTYDMRRYRFIRDLRVRAVTAGFFETIHYIFCDAERVKALGFTPLQPEKALLNPITNEMDTLRPSLMVTMLDSLKRNVSFSKRRIPLFEVGRVFDASRNERFHLLLVHAGERESETVDNAGKPEAIDFGSFVAKVAAVIGPFELEPVEAENGLMHPYQCAAITIEGERVGVLSKLHPEVAKQFDLPETYFAEITLPKLEQKHRFAEPIGTFTPVQRDLSVLVSKSLPYREIRQALRKGVPSSIKRFYPIDRYEDDKLGNEVSLTLRFVIEPQEKTMEESEIASLMDEILAILEKECGAKLR